MTARSIPHSRLISANIIRPCWRYGAATIPLSYRLAPKRSKRDIPKAEIRFLDTGHFALETHAAEIAEAIIGFVSR